MKKEYIHPSVEIIKFETSPLLAGSFDANAKRSNGVGGSDEKLWSDSDWDSLEED